MRTLLCACAIAVSVPLAAQEWPHFGGPRRDFTVDTTDIAASWPAAGPRKLWSRALGDGHSSIVVDGDRLYTMYSVADREFVVSLDRATGRTIWEKGNDAPAAGLLLQVEDLNVRGPHSTPTIAGNLLFTAGLRGKLQAFDKLTGSVVWSHDLWREFNAPRQERGYICSPLAYKNLVVVTIGGPGQGLAAFDQKTGTLVWKKLTFRPSFSSPTLINVDGQDQVVHGFADQFVGVDPNTGALLWQHPHPCGGFNVAPAIWGEDHILFISSAYECGSRALRVQQSGGKTTVTELWANTRLRVHHGTIGRVGTLVFGSSGQSDTAPMTALDIRTGALVWQDRTFPKTAFVYSGNMVILVDENGQLALARVSPQGMTVISKTTVLQRLAWTPPTLAGTNLYIRDQHTIAAFDLK